MDEKGRLTVPFRYRADLMPEGAYVMQGFDQNLIVLPSDKFAEISERVNRMSLTDSSARLLRRLVFSTANHVELDKAGRILLSQYLREFAGLESGSVIVGVGDYFEIWSLDAWEAQNKTLMDAQSNPDRFAALSLAV
ncbi:MAG: division/cell wall cluster transcriptional repressor MraZ [Anaerolineae bacterium]|nr:division/cell wall cluster transcriptional repressor MraZ [Anaerolineae bacterium]